MLYTIPCRVWTNLLLVTLLPLVYQGPHHGLAEGADLRRGGGYAPDPPGTNVWPSDAKLGLVLGGPPDLLPTLLAVYLTATTG